MDRSTLTVKRRSRLLCSGLHKRTWTCCLERRYAALNYDIDVCALPLSIKYCGLPLHCSKRAMHTIGKFIIQPAAVRHATWADASAVDNVASSVCCMPQLLGWLLYTVHAAVQILFASWQSCRLVDSTQCGVACFVGLCPSCCGDSTQHCKSGVACTACTTP